MYAYCSRVSSIYLPLFVNAAQSKRLRVIVEATRGAGVLSVGETEDFIDQGGIVKFVADNGRIQFQINHKAASDAGLYISSRLLVVATRVIE